MKIGAKISSWFSRLGGIGNPFKRKVSFGGEGDAKAKESTKLKTGGTKLENRGVSDKEGDEAQGGGKLDPKYMRLYPAGINPNEEGVFNNADLVKDMKELEGEWKAKQPKGVIARVKHHFVGSKPDNRYAEGDAPEVVKLLAPLTIKQVQKGGTGGVEGKKEGEVGWRERKEGDAEVAHGTTLRSVIESSISVIEKYIDAHGAIKHKNDRKAYDNGASFGGQRPIENKYNLLKVLQEVRDKVYLEWVVGELKDAKNGVLSDGMEVGVHFEAIKKIFEKQGKENELLRLGDDPDSQVLANEVERVMGELGWKG